MKHYIKAGILPVRFNVETSQSEFLLGQEKFQDNYVLSNTWSGFEGCSKRNEHVESAAAREFQEETCNAVPFLTHGNIPLKQLLEQRSFLWKIANPADTLFLVAIPFIKSQQIEQTFKENRFCLSTFNRRERVLTFRKKKFPPVYMFSGSDVIEESVDGDDLVGATSIVRWRVRAIVDTTITQCVTTKKTTLEITYSCVRAREHGTDNSEYIHMKKLEFPHGCKCTTQQLEAYVVWHEDYKQLVKDAVGYLAEFPRMASSLSTRHDSFSHEMGISVNRDFLEKRRVRWWTSEEIMSTTIVSHQFRSSFLEMFQFYNHVKIEASMEKVLEQVKENKGGSNAKHFGNDCCLQRLQCAVPSDRLQPSSAVEISCSVPVC
jgi:hypothetical protein